MSMTGMQLVEQFLGSSPFPALVGLQLDVIEQDRAVMLLPFRDEVVTIGTIVHGGAIATLIDTAATCAAWATPVPPENLRGTTVGLTVTYVAAADRADLRAEARVLRRGRNLSFIDVDVTDSS
ncbi:MAG: PaaI family thioesterase, partial [Actinobacteria bacterium]|nr:PaaI family thioesterase [Actinomycetota bacterium]